MVEQSEDGEVTVIERSFVLVRYRRRKYRCRCIGQALSRRTLPKPRVHADESHSRLMRKGECKRRWVWGVAGSEAVVYKLLDSRSSEAARGPG